MDEVDALLARVDSLPPAPKLLPQLMSALANFDCDIGRVVEMVSFDPALTVKLLQMCNSAYFSLSNRVTSVPEAVTRLGFHSIYDVVALMSGEQFLRPSQATQKNADRMWKHAVITAFAARSLATGMGVDSDLLFTAGLLHDIGKVPLTEALKGDYTALVTDTTLAGRTLVGLETASFGVDHAAVGARLLEQWRFSPEFVNGVRFHHDCRNAGEGARMAACIELADDLAHSLDVPEIEEPAPVLTSSDTLNILDLTENEITAHREEITENWHFVEKMCRTRA